MAAIETRILNPQAQGAGSVGMLIVWVGCSLAGTAAALASIFALMNLSPEWWRGLFAAGIASTLATAASLLPLIWSWHRGLHHRVAGYFMAAALRASVSLAACILAIKAGGYPAVPTMLLMVLIYFAVLATETTFVAKGLWDTKG